MNHECVSIKTESERDDGMQNIRVYTDSIKYKRGAKHEDAKKYKLRYVYVCIVLTSIHAALAATTQAKQHVQFIHKKNQSYNRRSEERVSIYRYMCVIEVDR